MQTLFPSRPRWRETRGWEGGGEGYWRKVSLEEQDSFLPPSAPPPLDPPMWQVEPTSALFSRAARGKWLRGWAMPNESRDAGYYYCLHHPHHSRNAGQISARIWASSKCVKCCRNVHTEHVKGSFISGLSVLGDLSEVIQNLKCFSNMRVICSIAWHCNPTSTHGCVLVPIKWLLSDRVGDDVSTCLWIVSLP